MAASQIIPVVAVGSTDMHSPFLSNVQFNIVQRNKNVATCYGYTSKVQVKVKLADHSDRAV
jgi:hypothetical protein